MTLAVAAESDFNDWEPQWGPERALSLKRARARSRLIAGLRRFFVAATGAAFASVFVFLALHTVQGGFAQRLFANAEPQQMVNPRFFGHSESGGPYVITAETAVRQAGDANRITITSPVYRTESGTVLVAPNGIYDEQSQQFLLQGEVLFRDPSGNRFSTYNLTIDLEGGRIIGANGVTGAGPLGVVEAGSYELRDADRALVLRGGVRGQIPERSQ